MIRFVNDLQDANKKLFKKKFFCLLLFEGTFCNAGIGEVKTKTNNTGLETEITVQVLNKFVVTV